MRSRPMSRLQNGSLPMVETSSTRSQITPPISYAPLRTTSRRNPWLLKVLMTPLDAHFNPSFLLILFIVEKALALGRRCEIVVYDWLVDCITPSNPKKRLRNEKPYTLNRTIQRLRKGEKDLPTYRRNFEDGVKASKELCDNSEPSLRCDEHIHVTSG